MDTPNRAAYGRRIWIRILVAGVVVVGGLTSAAPAWADEPGETEVGYLLVQQALGHLAHDKTSSGMDSAMEKIGDVLATEDQAGVNIAEVQQAKAALEAGQATQAQALLQHSITEAVSKLPPATGEETGTKVVLDPLPGRGALGGTGLAFLAASLLFVLLGVGLAYRFRPQYTIDQLRERLGNPTHPQVTAPPVTPTTDAS
ncbi:MAG: hypothetical protein ABI903_04370 [Actinomycetota bacterium]